MLFALVNIDLKLVLIFSDGVILLGFLNRERSVSWNDYIQILFLGVWIVSLDSKGKRGHILEG